MSWATYLRHLHAAYISKPATDRRVYQAIRRLRPRKIVELGVGAGQRALRMLRMAKELREEGVCYFGADLFEMRPPEQAGISLKTAHQRLSVVHGVKRRLAPGDVHSVLAREANSLVGTDLLLIGDHHPAESLEAAWYYVPRMLHDETVVLLQQRGAEDEAEPFVEVPREAIDELASAACRPSHRQRKAA